MNAKILVAAVAVLVATALTFPSIGRPPSGRGVDARPHDVPAGEMNGTWRNERNTFKIWALGNGKLQIAFRGTYESKSDLVRIANVGEGAGIAVLQGDTAILRLEGTGKGCRITLKFSDGSLIAKQEGACGFGSEVSADGTYRRVSRWKPRFEK
jgi:hypothetical protein